MKNMNASCSFVLSFIVILGVVLMPHAAMGQDPGESSSLVLVSGTINGEGVSPSSRTVVVSPGAAITGSFTVAINSSWPSNDVMAMGVTPTWGTPSTSYVDLGGFSTPVTGQQRTIDLKLTAPTAPGTYFIIAAFRAEYTAGEVMSCTNWQVGNLDWRTGYAIADWSLSNIDTANKKGTVLANYLFPGGNDPQYVPATAIKIVVKEPPCTLKDVLSYDEDSGTLTMKFTVGVNKAATWSAWLTTYNEITYLFSHSRPITDPPIAVTKTYTGLPKRGTVGVLSTLTTSDAGIYCSSYEQINTGAP